MEKHKLIYKIEDKIPELLSKIHLDKVYYDAQRRRALVLLLSDEPLGEEIFLQVKRIIAKNLRGVRVSLRIAAPKSGQAFLENPSLYADIITKALARKYPSLESWKDEISWKSHEGAIIVELPDAFSLQYARENTIQQTIEKVIEGVFQIKPPLILEVKGDTQKRMKRIEEERNKEKILAQEAIRKKLEIAEVKGTVKKKQSPKIYGRIIKGKPVEIATLTETSGTVIIAGRLMDVERKDVSGGEIVLLTFILNDLTGSIKCKVFMRYRSRWKKMAENQPGDITQAEISKLEKTIESIQNSQGLLVSGECQMDTFERDLVVMINDISTFDLPVRRDNAEQKRIELHAHTQMSNMDATVSASDLIQQAAKWGHPAIAITDSGVVQAFPEAFLAAQKYNIKLIPGLEGYMIDRGKAVKLPDERPLNSAIVVLDFETTGLNIHTDRMIEIGAVKIQDGKVVDTYSTFINPGTPLPPVITEITGITDGMLVDAPTAKEALPQLMAYIGDAVIAAHNAKFDAGILRSELMRIGKDFSIPILDTLTLAQQLYPDFKRYNLASVCRALGVKLKNAHRAVHDAKATAECLIIMLRELHNRGIDNLGQINQQLNELLRTRRSHVTLLATNQRGIQQLNELVSLSHLDYFNRVPTIPREEIEKRRHDLLIGSACEEGELYQAILDSASDQELDRMVSFYDYLEIQPKGNHKTMLVKGFVQDENELDQINQKIVELGQKHQKPVVATGDVHYLNKEDSVFRAVLQCGQNFSDYDIQPEAFFRTTDEMLAEFAFLGKEKAEEVVIYNPRKIMEKIGDMTLYPKHPENKTTFVPKWETAEDDIRTMTLNRAHELYGNPLPKLIQERLNKELTAITGYGYATLYSIANKLVANSLANGYLVGSRGSVGSSLVATMCGITEVNPLPPHYHCEHCKTVDFDVPKEYQVGVDLPRKDCPVCQKPFRQDGYDIPFEVFLGFKGDKVPDIDLNFSGEYQAKAHAYVEALFGEGFVYRAGTIGTLQDKTAYGFVHKYLEKSGKSATNAEIARLAAGCVGVKRTTGQHPGGLVILPKDYKIEQFTAVQHPADKVEQGIITTHYDFRSMHDILVKLDVLGHDDPTMIYQLEKLTGVHYTDIPLNDPKVMSLFSSPEALGVTEEQIQCATGTLGVPEFGTTFVRQMLLDTKPTTMSELIRISGLSHGTDVWLGNAKDLILDGTATLKDCICIRDDIMNYLISMGLPAKLSFDIMENVRKGKKLAPGTHMEDAMREKLVPEWFIESCKKIGYMFPKGHAVAYVTMALRIAWFKVYYPLAYYSAYFSIRSKGFDAELMVTQTMYLKHMLAELQAKDQKELQGKEKDMIVALEVVIEMNERGFTFLPVDLNRSAATEFLIEGDNKQLRCPFTSLPGFGEQAAYSIVEEREKHPFISEEDLKKRTKVTQTGIDQLRRCGGLSELSVTNQLSFF